MEIWEIKLQILDLKVKIVHIKLQLQDINPHLEDLAFVFMHLADGFTYILNYRNKYKVTITRTLKD